MIHVLLWIVAAWLIVNALAVIARIGKPRPVVTPAYAVAGVIELGLMLAVIITAAVTL